MTRSNDMGQTYDPDRDPMDLDTAVAVLRGTVPWPIVAADMEKATVVVLDELERLREERQPDCPIDGESTAVIGSMRREAVGEVARLWRAHRALELEEDGVPAELAAALNGLAQLWPNE